MKLFRWSFVALFTILMGSLSFITAWFPPRGRSMNRLGRIWARGFLRAWGVTIQSSPIPPSPDPRIIMANHASLLDIPVLFAVLPDRFVFLAKHSLFRVPFLGWAMSAAGFIPVNRVDRSRAKETFRKAKERLEQGLSILVFPEETRGPGTELLPFKKGAFLLSRLTGARVLPVAIQGAASIITKDNHFMGPGTVRVRFGCEETLERGEDIETQMERLRKIMAELLSPRADAKES